MADVTFGVKVTEEMKNELAEMMKNTQLTGKEFMGLLLSSYKLEKSKKEQNFWIQDIEELQRLLQRIQSMYLNMGEKMTFAIEDQLLEIQKQVDEKEEIHSRLIKERDELKEISKKEEEKYTQLEQSNETLQATIKAQEEKFEEQRRIIKQHDTLCHKYEEEIKRLNEEIERFGRLELEIEERNHEIEKAKQRNDELASELWFAQREVEKLKEIDLSLKQEHEKELKGLTEKFELELKNNLLEQKVIFNNKLEVLRGEHYKEQQILQEKLQNFLMTSSDSNKLPIKSIEK